MKKIVSGLASLMLVPTAFSQSSVTVFGVIDATYQHYRQAGASVDRLNGAGGNQFSRLGFRGSEDLGGGLSAGFTLDMGLNIDTGLGGASSANNQAAIPAGSLLFNRRSTVSLVSNALGEIRLGRDFTPTYWNLTLFDPFGTAGAGSSVNISQSNLSQSSTVQTALRVSNSIGYFLPRLGGFYGQAMVAYGENASTAGNSREDGDYAAFRLGYAAGGLDIALAHGKTTLFSGDVTSTNLGVSCDFGVVKPMAQYFEDRKEKISSPDKSSGALVGVNLQWGAGYLPVSYSRIHNNSAAGARANQFAVGYVHPLSRRTAVYTTASRIRNEGGAAVAAVGVAGVANATWTGLDIGIRHTF